MYLNNDRIESPEDKVDASRLLFGKHLLLRKGKKNYTVLTAV